MILDYDEYIKMGYIDYTDDTKNAEQKKDEITRAIQLAEKTVRILTEIDSDEKLSQDTIDNLRHSIACEAEFLLRYDGSLWTGTCVPGNRFDGEKTIPVSPATMTILKLSGLYSNKIKYNLCMENKIK